MAQQPRTPNPHQWVNGLDHLDRQLINFGINRVALLLDCSFADAAFIVLACNMHEGLVEACKAAKGSFEQLIKINRIPESIEGYRLVCAALAKAEGK